MTPRTRRQFSPEFKAEAVSLVGSSGKTVAQLSRELALSETALRNWVERAQPPVSSDLSPTERQELLQLCKENRVLKMERELLKNSPREFSYLWGEKLAA